MLDIKEENNGTWFSLDDKNPDEFGFCMRLPIGEEYDKIEEKCTIKKRKFDKRTHEYVISKSLDEKKSERLRWDYMIVDWKPFKLGGVVLECNADNKLRVVNHPVTSKFIGDCIVKLNEQTDITNIAEEARLKNLKTASNGGPGKSPATPA